MSTENVGLIVFLGWPLSGKSTIADRVSERLDIHHVDIDRLRAVAFGVPHPHPEESEGLRERDGLEMRGSYELLLQVARIYLRHGRSVIISATFSRRTGQEELAGVFGEFPDAETRVIWCYPENDGPEEVARCLEARRFGEGHFGAVNTPERYLEVKRRYEPVELPCLKLSTMPPHTIEECVEKALSFIAG